MRKSKRSVSSISSSFTSLSSRNSKKIRLIPSNHAPTCDDSACTGCDVSEIEVAFTTEDGQGEIELSPDKILQLAIEESSKELSQEHGGGIVKRLFDMAFEEFDKLIIREEQEAEAEIVKGKAKELKETRQKLATKQTRYQYASCCVAFGIYLPLIEQIRKGIEIFKQIIIEDDGYYDAWIGLGRARISLARIERETSQDELSDSSDSEEEQESFIKTAQDSYNLAKDALDKGLFILRSKDLNKYTIESILAAKDLQEYALSIDHSRFTEYAQEIFTQAIDYLQAVYDLNKNLEENNFAQGIWGCCLYYLAKLKTNKNSANFENESKLLLNNAIEKLLKAFTDTTDTLGKDRFTEILGQAYILKTTIENDEEQVIELYEKGLECLKKAYRLSPDNENLREQLETLGVFDIDDEEDYDIK